MNFSNFSIIILFLFAFSGLMKWLGLPFDPTFVFGLLSLFTTLFYATRYPFHQLGLFHWPFVMFFVFHGFYFLTAVYTSSESYYLEKLSRVFFNLIAFFAPIVIFKTNSNFIFFKKLSGIFFVLGIALVIYNWFENKLIIFLIIYPEAELIVPTYMSIAYFLGSFMFLFTDKKSLKWTVLKVIAFLFIILLASKGAILFALLIFLFSFNLKLIFNKKNLKYIVPLVLLLTFYLANSGIDIFENLNSRIFIGDDFGQDRSSQARLNFFDYAINLINDNLIFGIGVASFSILATGIDDRLSPHNILVEVLLESGIIGLTLLLFTIYFFYRAFKNTLLNVVDKIEYKSFLYPCIYIFMGDLVSGIIEDSRTNYFWLGLAVSYFVYKTNELRNDSNNKLVIN